MKNLITTLVLVCSQALNANILVNADFEDLDMSAWNREAISGIRPWSIGSASPQSGSRYVFTVDEAKLSQTFAATSGASIDEFSFWLDLPDTATLQLEIFYENEETSGVIGISSGGLSGWSKYDATTLIDQGKSLTGIQITKTGLGTVRLDNFILKEKVPSTTLSINGDFVAVEFFGILQHSNNLTDWYDFDPQPTSPYTEAISGIRFFRVRTE